MTSPTYCAPCIADLALVREAATTVAGTASCLAHAVLLSHATDDPGRRRQRLDALKDLATSKAETAEPSEQVKLELLVQEYGLAGAMDMGQPARRGPQPQPVRQGAPSAPGEGRKSRRGRARGDRPEGQGAAGAPGQGQPRGERRPAQGAPAEGGAPAGADASGETAPVTPAPGPAGEGAPADTSAISSAAQSSPVSDAPSAPSAPAPEAPSAPAAAPVSAPAAAPAAAAPDAPVAPAVVPPSSAPDA